MRLPPGRFLNNFYKLGALHALARMNGKWYHHLVRFPGVLFDAHGYVKFNSEQEYQECHSFVFGERLHVSGNGICDLPNYERLEPPPLAIKNA